MTTADTRRAVKAGTIAGHWDTVAERFTPLPSDQQPPCAECWAGVSHTGPGWAQHREDVA